MSLMGHSRHFWRCLGPYDFHADDQRRTQSLERARAMHPALPPPKFVVEARADDIFGERNCRRGAPAACDRTGKVPEIDMQVFNLRSPVRRKGEFDTGARCPSSLSTGRGRGGSYRGLNVAESAATGSIDKDPIPAPAHPAANGR
jgi:hypothetical protein